MRHSAAWGWMGRCWRWGWAAEWIHSERKRRTWNGRWWIESAGARRAFSFAFSVAPCLFWYTHALSALRSALLQRRDGQRRAAQGREDGRGDGMGRGHFTARRLALHHLQLQPPVQAGDDLFWGWLDGDEGDGGAVAAGELKEREEREVDGWRVRVRAVWFSGPKTAGFFVCVCFACVCPICVFACVCFVCACAGERERAGDGERRKCKEAEVEAWCHERERENNAPPWPPPPPRPGFRPETRRPGGRVRSHRAGRAWGREGSRGAKRRGAAAERKGRMMDERGARFSLPHSYTFFPGPRTATASHPPTMPACLSTRLTVTAPLACRCVGVRAERKGSACAARREHALVAPDAARLARALPQPPTPAPRPEPPRS